MFVADKWKDLEVLYAGDAEKLERWGDIYLRRPDPQAIWPMDPNEERPHAVYQRSSTGGGSWERRKPMPNSWKISYDSLGKTLNFIIEPTSFKHTGLFPEQAANWDWFGNIIENAVKEGRDDIKILNLFAYTGGATCAAACHGAAETVHVDASKGMIQRAKENIEASGLGDKYVRFIAEDCRRFVEREIRRGRKYDGIIMDPPKYGRGPTGELWEIDKSLYEFVDRCSLLLSDEPLFFLISSYATELGPSCAGNVLKKVVGTKFGGKVDCDELGLPISKMGFDLPCGQSARWSRT
ncbi:23S rRNA (cytosine1962-C5)-methyltransferase [Oscillospiraceae bacterium]|nr:23S rRNA (cytosine1962-C5)-methyltransferase [Oscillospiraceae bacterium]